MSIIPTPMKLLVLPILAVGAGIVGSVAVLGCGDSEGLPDDAVAGVGDTVITKSDFERALTFATGRGNDPRDYAACVAAKQQPTGEPMGTQLAEAELEEQCRNEYEQIKRNVMDYLIKAEWTRKEAEARGIVLTDAELEQAVEKAEHAGFLDSEALGKAGVSERELLARLRQSELERKVTGQVTERSSKLSAQDIADYYRRNKADLVVPDRREMRIVITRSRVKAQAARTALGAGRSWRSVAKEYSLHVSRNEGGRITAQWKGEDKAGLGATIFRARPGELVGPVRDDATWAVFVVDKIKRSYVPTLEQAHDEIAEDLRSARQKQALEAYRAKYRDQTTCAPDFKVAACKNGPKQTEDEASA